YSSKRLLECYRRAEPHWERRHEVRARSTETVKRGVGMASQVWYGGGGPPSYAWVRVGSDGHATVVTAMQDIGTGTSTAMAQIAGGISQGVGHTLSEERLHDPRTGQILTTTLDAYKLPTIADVPEIVCELLDQPDEHLTNLGSKGLGEPPIVPVAAAIANAIRDATGADIRSLPITREEMLNALREARERRKEGRAAPAAV